MPPREPRARGTALRAVQDAAPTPAVARAASRAGSVRPPWRGRSLTAVALPPRSSDFGTSYTKLALQPGVATVIDSFYICPTNKRKVRAGPRRPHRVAGPAADRLGVRALTPASIAPASSASVLRFGERGRRHRLASQGGGSVLCLSSLAPRPHPGPGGEQAGSRRGSFLVRVLVGRGEQPRRLHGSVGFRFTWL